MRHFLDSKVHGANMGLTWGRQDPGGPHEPCYLGYPPPLQKKRHTVQCHCNTVNFLPNPYNRYPIAPVFYEHKVWLTFCLNFWIAVCSIMLYLTLLSQYQTVYGYPFECWCMEQKMHGRKLGHHSAKPPTDVEKSNVLAISENRKNLLQNVGFHFLKFLECIETNQTEYPVNSYKMIPEKVLWDNMALISPTTQEIYKKRFTLYNMYFGHSTVLGAYFVNLTVRPTILSVTFQQISTLYFKKYNLLWVYLFYLLKNMSLDVLVK